jgi:coenzyme F420-0:L-glutamate ligase/coenzyme F420-1:gamma-L-glutamate ligase
MHSPAIQIIELPGLPEIAAGDDLSSLITTALRKLKIDLLERDILVIAQKIVSKAEGRLVNLETISPSADAIAWATEFNKDARAVEVVRRESKRIVRMERGIIISETSHGFICANAGVDTSNVPAGYVALLPEDPDASAQRIKERLEREFGVRLAIIISDTFGRPWREGLVNVAIGVAGIAPLIDYRGELDSHGQPLRVTVIAIADELASAAELVMKKSAGVPVAIISGAAFDATGNGVRDLIRKPELDLFR